MKHLKGCKPGIDEQGCKCFCHTMAKHHIGKPFNKQVSVKPNIKRVEVKKGNMLAIGVQDLNKQPKDYTKYQLTIYKDAKKIHQEDMKVHGAGKFVIDKQEVEEAAQFVNNAVVFVS